ncbi:hypothetical protein B5E82_05965 [Lachnoclostridium sp. An138]|nr:hypothetical protein B5E82_05965 [Lachnoclostridium sp. An138]
MGRSRESSEQKRRYREGRIKIRFFPGNENPLLIKKTEKTEKSRNILFNYRKVCYNKASLFMRLGEEK